MSEGRVRVPAGPPLDDLDAIERLDPHAAREVLRRFPDQCREGLGLHPSPPVRLALPRLVVVAGMGGSAASGDLLATCLADRLSVPVLTHRGYGLPALVGPGALVIAASYSGETVEAVSAFEAAVKAGAATAAVTRGGRLAALAARHGAPVVTLPPGLMPRMALGSLFFPLLGILESAGLPTVPEAEVAEALETVAALADELAPARPVEQNEAKRLALAVGDRVPVVYGGELTGSVAYRWKTDVEENAKRFAVAGALPEMNHNEIEAWRAPEADRLQAIFLRDRGEHPDVARRFAVVRALVEPVAGGLAEVWSRGEGRLARLLSLIYLGQWTSYYLALLRGVDPWAVPLLEEVKRRLRP
ncbi:MAG: bifunctional phosphoglucose/phosphomannose isomerase [Candidatus Rokubacteria bacterium]|nr:bifunctional phosphoglucose/phosphomannose isomerase [Candidatus Rokubacteria bacterium]